MKCLGTTWVGWREDGNITPRFVMRCSLCGYLTEHVARERGHEDIRHNNRFAADTGAPLKTGVRLLQVSSKFKA